MRSVVLQADGKIVVAGNFYYIITGPGVSVPRSGVARFNSDGTFDPTYDPGTGLVLSTATPGFDPTFAIQQRNAPNNGKVILGGHFDKFDGHPVPGLVRLNTDGSFDSTFTPGAGPGADTSLLTGLFVQSDDQVVVFGTFVSFSGAPCNGIVRLSSAGIRDASFNPSPFRNYKDPGTISALAEQADGKLVVGGYFHSLDGVTANNVARLETNGARDPSFDSLAAGPQADNVSALLVRAADGKIFVGGYFSTFGGAIRNNVAWANSNGSVDSAFEGLSGATDLAPIIYALATQPDGKILVGGFFSSLNGASRYNFLRLNPDGTVDSTFGVAFGTNGTVRAIVIHRMARF